MKAIIGRVGKGGRRPPCPRAASSVGTARKERAFAHPTIFGKSMVASAVAALWALTASEVVHAGAEDEVGALFDKFVSAQNAHDLGAVRDILWNSPQFFWITRG